MRHGCIALAFCAVSASACSSNAQIATIRSLEPAQPQLNVSKVEPVLAHEGKASYYSDSFNGRRTASGERFSQHKLTAASRKFPLGSRVLVTNADNGKSVEVVINDRGPYVKGRVIDLSKKAAQQLGMIEDGVVDVRVEAQPVFPRNRRPREEASPMVAEIASPAEGAVAALPVATDFPIDFPEPAISDLGASDLGVQDRRVAAAQ